VERRLKNAESGSKSMNKEVTLTGPQADICRAALSQQLLKTCQLLGKSQNASGDPLDDEERYDLVRFSMDLQTTLLALGMTSEQLERLVETFS
jgi:hypothetical protein